MTARAIFTFSPPLWERYGRFVPAILEIQTSKLFTICFVLRCSFSVRMSTAIRPPGHGCEDVVAAVHNFGDDTTNNHVLDAVKAKGGGQCGVVVQHLRRRCDVLPQLCRLCFGFRDAFQLRLDGAALGRQVIDGRPVGVSDRLEAGELIVLGGEPRQKVGRAARGFGPLRRKVGDVALELCQVCFKRRSGRLCCKAVRQLRCDGFCAENEHTQIIGSLGRLPGGR